MIHPVLSAHCLWELIFCLAEGVGVGWGCVNQAKLKNTQQVHTFDQIQKERYWIWILWNLVLMVMLGNLPCVCVSPDVVVWIMHSLSCLSQLFSIRSVPPLILLKCCFRSWDMTHIVYFIHLAFTCPYHCLCHCSAYIIYFYVYNCFIVQKKKSF